MAPCKCNRDPHKCGSVGYVQRIAKRHSIAAHSMLQLLPVEVLRLVWDALKSTAMLPSDPQPSQHALRCTCRAMRDASTHWIDGMVIETYSHTPQTDVALVQLERFPLAAHMKCMLWEASDRDLEEDDSGTAAVDVSTFFLRGAARLAHLVRLMLHVPQVSLHMYVTFLFTSSSG